VADLSGIQASLHPVALDDFAPQGSLYEGLVHTLREGTFVHAYLLSGLEGMGKRTLAQCMAQFLLCTGPDKPCGMCPACQQVAANNHPDLIVVQPGKPISPEVKSGLKSIPVKDIRAVVDITSRHTYAGGRRVVIIQQAHKMTPGAQNALLKTLEEPLGETVFLLITEAPEMLLSTIVSRCRALKLHPWPDDALLRVLKARGVEEHRARQAIAVSGGSMGRALEVADDEAFWQRRQDVMQDFFSLEKRSDILRISNQWRERKDDASELLNDVEDMVRTLMLVRLGHRDESALTGYPEKWQTLARKADVAAFVRLLDAVAEARRLRSQQVTWQAVVEKLLLRLMEERNQW